jgi:hypothetical protein
MNQFLKIILRICIQAGIGTSILILYVDKPNIPSWVPVIMFVILWTTLWVGYDSLMRIE